MAVVEVRLWGTTVGAASMDDGARAARFEYDPTFLGSGRELSPLMMPLTPVVYHFPALPEAAFHGLPGMLADALPDRFGQRIIDAWLAGQGRAPGDMSPLERLCYVGTRGMGALEFQPDARPDATAAERLHVDALVELASTVLAGRAALSGSFDDPVRAATTAEILKVGTSAGGARAKAIIAWDPATNEVRSGQGDLPPGFEHWLLKFDGVRGNRDRDRLDDPQGFGAVEYAYSLMARRAGIDMPETRLLEESGRRHFMARRFDRDVAGRKHHMQSLGALAHLDYNDPLANGYEDAFRVLRHLGVAATQMEEQFRRTVFNVMARNHDDHVKNIAFLMDRDGTWSLSPAFDVTYAFNPEGRWTAQHQMSIGGARHDITRDDLLTLAAGHASITRRRADEIVDHVRAAVLTWDDAAHEAGVDAAQARAIGAVLLPDLT